MTAPLEIDELINALETFGTRYHAVDVFADDLSERALKIVELGSYDRDGKGYRFSVYEEHGVVRAQRAEGSNAVAGAVAGTAIGAAVAAAAKQKPEGIFGGALLGLLVGAALGQATQEYKPPRRVFALQLDPSTRQWVAYDGSLLRWMKSRLLAPTKSVA